jgi:hypothetical protein
MKEKGKAHPGSLVFSFGYCGLSVKIFLHIVRGGSNISC